jgi:hypothetical protein
MMAKYGISGGSNTAIKIPKFKYDETVYFYKEILKLPYLGFTSGSHAFQFGSNTLWLDCMENYSQQDVWLEITAADVEKVSNYLEENGVSRRDEVEVYENSKGYWISDPSGSILRVNQQKTS